MTDTKTLDTKTLVLSQDGGRVAVTVDGNVLGTVKDGGHIVRNVDRVLRNHDILRTSAYSVNAAGELTATAI